MDAKLIEIKEMLITYAKQKAWTEDEDFEVDDYAAGNIDDAFWGGVSDGKTMLARDIIKIINR